MHTIKKIQIIIFIFNSLAVPVFDIPLGLFLKVFTFRINDPTINERYYASTFQQQQSNDIKK